MAKPIQHAHTKNLASWLTGLAVVLSSGMATATSGNITLASGNWYMEEDHHGTLVLASNSTLNCNGYAIYNPGDNDPVCWDEDGSPFRCGIYIEAQNVQVTNCVVRWHTQGVTVYNGYLVSINDSRLADNDDGAHFCYGGGYTAGDLLLNNDDISWNTGEGVNLFDVYGVRVSNSYVWWNNVDGIDGDATHYLAINNSSLVENGDHAIELDTGADHNILANWIDGRDDRFRYKTQARDGIQLQETSAFNIESNTVRDAGRHGIYTHDSSSGTIHHNDVSGSDQNKSDGDSGYDCRKNGGSSITYHGNTFGTVNNCSR